MEIPNALSFCETLHLLRQKEAVFWGGASRNSVCEYSQTTASRHLWRPLGRELVSLTRFRDAVLQARGKEIQSVKCFAWVGCVRQSHSVIVQISFLSVFVIPPISQAGDASVFHKFLFSLHCRICMSF